MIIYIARPITAGFQVEIETDLRAAIITCIQGELEIGSGCNTRRGRSDGPGIGDIPCVRRITRRTNGL